MEKNKLNIFLGYCAFVYLEKVYDDIIRKEL